MRRYEFSAKVKAAAFERADGLCEASGPAYGLAEFERCAAVLTANKYQFDHYWPASEGGDASLENCLCVCQPCHGHKTGKRDMPLIAKIRRARNKHLGFKKASAFPASRTGPFKKRIDGTVERRRK